jgi:hypothetical protein
MVPAIMFRSFATVAIFIAAFRSSAQFSPT